MTSRALPGLQAESFRVDCSPLHQLQPLDGKSWRSQGDDPQFLLVWPAGMAAGAYRITLRIEGGDAEGPSIYLDAGDGWSEATRLSFQPQGEGGRWSLIVWLTSSPAPARIDPVSREGEFRFDSVVIERLAEAGLLLASLRRRVEDQPEAAVALVRDADHIVRSVGEQAGWRFLQSDNASPVPGGDAALDYGAWVREYDSLSPAELATARRSVARLPRRPLVSLLLPADGVARRHLDDCLRALVAQAYPDWELRVLAGPGLPPATLAGLRAWEERDGRVRVLLPRDDAPPAQSLQDALDGARGEWVGVLEDAPVLAAHALLAFAEAMARHGDAGILYCDADRLDDAGVRVDPYLKPDWNPDLFLAQDYLNPLALYDARLVAEAGGLRAGFDGALSADLTLRCVAACEPRRVVHVPLLLCHARVQATGARAHPAARRALQEHLGTEDGDVGLVPVRWGHHLQRALPAPAPRVSLVVPTRDRVDLLRRCVDSICSRSTYPDFEVLVVDNQSSEPETLAYLDSLGGRPNVRVLAYDHPFNYSAINNYAVGLAEGTIVGLVNNDIEVISPDWLEQMVQHAVRPGVGAVGAMLYYPDDTIQHAGVIVGLGGVAGHPYLRAPRGTEGQRGRAGLVQELAAVTGACLLVRRSTYLEVGGLDERLAVAFNDIDFCLRLRAAGWRNVWTPLAELYHHESASRGIEDTPQKRARFASEVDFMVGAWGKVLAADPAYHPSLSLLHDDAFELGIPPRQSSRSWIRNLTIQP